MWCPTTILILLCIYLICEVAVQVAVQAGDARIRARTPVHTAVLVAWTILHISRWLGVAIIHTSFVR
jgi:hypothetical protein